MKPKTIITIAITLFVLLAIAWLLLNKVAAGGESSNVYSVSEIRYDDSTYNYVKEKCDEGFFSEDSENCVNLREARP